MKGRHDTYLIYVSDGGELEVGIVSCVPYIGQVVMLPGGAHRVEQVEWHVGADPIGAYSPASCTVVRVSLSRCP